MRILLAVAIAIALALTANAAAASGTVKHGKSDLAGNPHVKGSRRL